MVKANWGIKRTCRKCSANFYDLKKEPIACPKCLTTYSSSDFASKYVKSSDSKEKRDSKKAVVFDDVALIDDVPLDEEILGDDSDLEQDVGSVLDRDGDDDAAQN